MCEIPDFRVGREFPEVETGSILTASATTQFPESLITETLREQAALARPIRQQDFRYLVSGM